MTDVNLQATVASTLELKCLESSAKFQKHCNVKLNKNTVLLQT